MYSWDGDTSSWYGDGAYSYGTRGADVRRKAAARAAASGPRTYEVKRGPHEAVVDPRKTIRTESRNPLVVAVDVTGSMSSWPFEIFDRLPLLFNTLSQYREDLEISFVAIGDAAVDRWPLQTTEFAKGFDLEQLLGSLYGEGGGGDAPESYGLFAAWMNRRVEIPKADGKPFLIVFGDITMHPTVPADQLHRILEEKAGSDLDALEEWRRVAERWNTWFLRRPAGGRGDEVDQQWGRAIGEKKVFHIQDEQRAVDTAMAIIARAWGHFDDFRKNMRARQPDEVVARLSTPIAMMCPSCGAPIPTDAAGLFSCRFCGSTLRL